MKVRIYTVILLLFVVMIFGKDVMGKQIAKSDLIRIHTVEGFAAGCFWNTCLMQDGVCMDEHSDKCVGEYISPVIEPGFEFSECIPSWVVITPDAGFFTVEVRVSADGNQWSSWLHLGSWHTMEKKRTLKDALAFVDTDCIETVKPLRFCQVKFRLGRSVEGSSPIIKSLSLAFCNFSDSEPARKFSVSESFFVNIAVPYRSQGWEDGSISGHICSITSTSMVMAYWDKDIPTKDLAEKVYDRENDMYGIWWRAVQTAGQYGFDGWVRYFRNWDDVLSLLAKDIPVIACICFGPGELKGSMTDSSLGHVIVVRGFDGKGGVICNDPAGSNDEEGMVVYSGHELGKAWFGKAGGVGYVIVPESVSR